MTEFEEYNLYKKVLEFASVAHDGQYRKFSNVPYITHPVDVSILVRKYGGDIYQQVASLLHDVVEDTKYTIEDIEERFGSDVAYLVTGMTATYDDSATGEEKSASEMARFALIQDPRILLIKMCDIHSNLSTIKKTSDTFRERFVKGKTELAVMIGKKPTFESPIIDVVYLLLLDAT